MRTDLRDSGVLPQSEPYTALGHDLFNAGSWPPRPSGTPPGLTGRWIWVVLELRNNDAGYSFGRLRSILKATGMRWTL